MKRIEGKIEFFIEEQIVDQQTELKELVDQYEKILDEFKTNDMTTEEHDKCIKMSKSFMHMCKSQKVS